ncbi:hypothetical protein RFI_01508 [Reticulomyxa filosa]|uniref:Uncharacterized protein n=1 Tax=Reticulomyxa filosa TaxID=46433 RepID=X6PAJ5_RETFI|nr:hypothetical protein RFI_01508 [Reticulomyxa filosa]|eukprot:ETO35555.1 hypothetical protein RFI_01508 [Reticulomyxa filosa]
MYSIVTLSQVASMSDQTQANKNFEFPENQMQLLRVMTKNTVLTTSALVVSLLFNASWIYWEYTNVELESFGVLLNYYNISIVVNAICVVLSFSFASKYYRFFCQWKLSSHNNRHCSFHTCCFTFFKYIAVVRYKHINFKNMEAVELELKAASSLSTE